MAGRWSSLAALRAVRAAVILPAILAVTAVLIGNPEMATYAAFGTFANLVLAPFSGSRGDKLVAHLGLGLVGGALLSIGTAVHGNTALAAGVTLMVTFAVLLAGITGANAATGGVAAMLAYVLAAASPGLNSMIPSRLAGWWLATAAAALATVLTSTRQSRSPLWVASAASAAALSQEIVALSTGSPDASSRARSLAAQERLRALFNAAPYRPTGLAVADQALSNLIGLLDWVSSLVVDSVAYQVKIGELEGSNQALMSCAGEVLGTVADVLGGADVLPDLERLERLRVEHVAALRQPVEDMTNAQAAVHAAFHARTVAVAVRSVAADALVATRRATPEVVAEQRMAWVPASSTTPGPSGIDPAGPSPHPRRARLLRALPATLSPVFVHHASIRSVWVRNSLRGAVAVSAAVLVADLTKVQHGFWVVLGTLAVLRTTATATGGTALRAIGGTVLGFLVGAGVVVAVGTSTPALWAALPVAVLLAAYAPGVAPYALGQASFTAMLVILYNLIVPVGWKVGAIRVEDVAIGCAISLVVGVLAWPRGALTVVADDLHDAFVTAGGYLVQATEWALSNREARPDSGRAAVVASLRLDDALRAFLTEQGAKSVPKEDLWTLVGAAQQLRLASASLAELPTSAPTGTLGEDICERARALADWYQAVASHIRGAPPAELVVLEPWERLMPADTCPWRQLSCQLYVDQYLWHIHLHHRALIGPANRLYRAVREPWWRHASAATALPPATEHPPALAGSQAT